MFFGFATFISQIMMMNMLIAIMTDSYEKVIENASINGTKTKLELLSDLAFAQNRPDKNKTVNEYQFLFLVQPIDSEGKSSDKWEGVIGELNKANQRANQDMQNQLTKLLMSLHEQTEEEIKRDIN